MRSKIVSLLVAAFSLGVVQAASAADMPTKIPMKAPMAAPMFNWTGFYVGIEGGGAWGHSRHDSTTVGFPFELADFNVSGGILGGTVGYNWQAIGSPWVLGIEGDGSWTNAKGTGTDLPPFATTFVQETQQKWLATFRGRAGYAWDRWMLYATGGGALSKVDTNEHLATTPTIGVYDTKTIWGWTAGAGIEGAIFGNWTAKAEYLYVNFGKNGYFAPPLTPGNCGCVSADVSLHEHIFRVGLNYLFK